MNGRNLAYQVFEFEVYTNPNQAISESLTQTWTEQAVECYSIGCDCSKCSITKARYSFRCKMSEVVGILLEKYGEPQQELSV